MAKNDYGVEESSSSGFANFVEADITAMFNNAMVGEANDEEDKNTVFSTTVASEVEREPESSATVVEPPHVKETYEAPLSVTTEAAPITPEPEPTVVDTPESTTAFAHNKTVTVDANSSMVARIIKTLDTYRDLRPDTQSVAAQFICNDSEADPNDEVSIVVNALSSDETKGVSMLHLVKAYNENERVERLYYLLQIASSQANALGTLVELITGKTDFSRRDRIKYAKELETCINDMDPAIVEYVSSTQRVLDAAKASNM